MRFAYRNITFKPNFNLRVFGLFNFFREDANIFFLACRRS